jgi:uncharacterized protein YjcR
MEPSLHSLIWWESQKVRDHWEDLNVGGWTILKWILEIGWDGMDWIDVAQDRDQWRALVNTVMNLRVPFNVGNFLSGCTIDSFSRRAQLHE